MPINLPDLVSDYVSKKTFSKWRLEWNEIDGIETVVVVPAICEFENIKRLLASLVCNPNKSFQKTLIVFVINNSNCDTIEIRHDNAHSINFLRSILHKNFSNNEVKKVIESEIQIGLIDASSAGNEFEESKAGVGLARKIGMDMALQIFDYSSDRKKIIACLDADCVVENNYISEIRQTFDQNNYPVALVDFEHLLPDDNKNRSGILSYEIFLRQYVCGLLFANSPYAFHTVGSTIICENEAYIKAGGMNNRKAAEDFYFLQKLAKSFTIGRITSTIVHPSARESWRVPFGTGRSMIDYLSDKKIISFFDPDIYLILNKWNEIYNSDLLLNPDSLLKEAKTIHPEVYNFLVQKKFLDEWEKILQNTSSTKQLNYQRKNWFDAFKTLKLVHQLRDTAFPMVDILGGIQKLFKLVGLSVKFDLSSQTNNKIEILEHYLAELKNLENDFYNRNSK